MPRKKKNVSTWLPVFLVLFLATLGSVVLVFVFRAELKDSLRFFTQNSPPRNEELKIEHIFRNYPEGSLGIDVSEYQGKIDFPELQLQLENHPIEFVFVRATMGDDGVDKQFRRNWEGFGNMPVLLGAYHYYRPNENSSKQAENFIKTAKLKPGNLIPVLDIEKHSTIQSREKLREGLKNWLRIVEEHYGVKPMIYTGDRFFWDVLHGHGFDGYPIWVANYNLIVEPETEDWEIWQFSEKGRLPGIRERIDLNVFQDGSEYLQSLVIPG
ncbi:glycoside hydrolase family 25 protein [Algoriphagus sp. H41]|uniref:Glycoside hydrolase family 25 protein n=1 Tax=Algoriphagus oliviformis TaxID=2811231 RepID=A0ABS3C026_9BACT|nr:glycoside hydrolase family 25 protein [Algoriphagus oliviformis]MBN7810287.1 glycoside hydrolase family 25 protein [Algoriphagus oliviformis]